MRPNHRSRLRLWLSLTTVSVLAVWILVTQVTNVNPVDFLVYRYGAQATITGTDVYSSNLNGPMMPPGGMPFTYTPFASLTLAPTVLFDARTAYLLWSLFTLAVVAWTVDRFVPYQIRHRTPVVIALTVAASATSMVTQHVFYGQINIPLMGLVLYDLLRPSTSRSLTIAPRGLLVGLAAAIKLTPALFIVFLLLTRQWRTAMWAAIGAVGASLVGTVVLPDVSAHFWTEILWTLSERVDLTGAGISSSGNNSIQGFLAAALPNMPELFIPGTLLAATVSLALAYRTWARGARTEAILIVGLAAPIISPVSWIHHWVYLIPALILILFRTRSLHGRIGIMAIFAVLIIGPGLGDLLLDMDLAAIVPIGWIARECLLITSIISIATLAAGPTDLKSHDLPRKIHAPARRRPQLWPHPTVDKTQRNV